MGGGISCSLPTASIDTLDNTFLSQPTKSSKRWAKYKEQVNAKRRQVYEQNPENKRSKSLAWYYLHPSPVRRRAFETYHSNPSPARRRALEAYHLNPSPAR